MGPFKRSGTFGLVGVFVVMALCAFIALTMGQGEANPKDALALIFGVIGVYIVLLFLFQTRDLSKAEAADAQAATLTAEEIENPATLDEPKLFAALAIRPIDADAVRARMEIWGSTRQSIRLGMLICALIFLTVPPVYLLETWITVIVGVPLIAGIALWKSVSLLSSGGDLDQAYERSSRAMAPLGLSVAERPEVVIEPKSAAPFRMGTTVRGALVLEGERHGRHVTVRMPAEGVRSKSEVHVATHAPKFEFKSSDGKLRPAKGARDEVRQALRAVPGSTRWTGVRGAGGEEGISVERKGVGGGEWLLDLWVAERLADALDRSPTAPRA